jgi:hypothetical protein
LLEELLHVIFLKIHRKGLKKFIPKEKKKNGGKIVVEEEKEEEVRK